MVNYPSDWKREKLGNCIDRYINGTSLEEFFTKNSSNRVISLGNYSEDGKYIDDGNRIVINSKTSKYLVDKDDLCMVLNDKGNGRLVGKVILIEKDNEYIINQRSLRLVINKDKVLSIFLHQLINSEVFRSKLVKYIQGNTQVYINPPAIMEIEIDIPENRDEQKVISKALLTFDKHIENLSKLIEKKKMIRDGSIEDLMTGKTRLDGFEDAWKEVKLCNVTEILTGLTYSPEDVKKNGLLVLRSSNIQNDKLVFNDNVYVDESKIYSSRVKVGDIIMCVRNGSSSLIGKTAIVREKIDATFGAFMSNLRCYDFISKGFIYYFFKTSKFREEVDKILGATINQITKSDLNKLVFTVPTDIKEQEAIASILTSMDKEIENLEKEKEKYIQLKSGAMDDLLTGKIRLV